MCWARVISAPFRIPVRFQYHLPKPREQKCDWRGTSGSAAPSGHHVGCWIVSKGHAVFWCSGFLDPPQVWSLQGGSHSGSLPTSYLPYQSQTLGKPGFTVILHNLASFLGLLALNWNSRVVASWFQVGIMISLGRAGLCHIGPLQRNGSLAHFLMC